MKQFALKSAALATCALGLFATATPASAGVITYDFTLDQCSSGGCGLANYGSVTVTDILGGGVTVHTALLNGSGLIDSGALSSHSLVFNLAGEPAIAITGLPALWSYTATSFTPNSGYFGTFNYVIDCNTGCAPNNPYTAALDFTITTTSVTTASFIDGGSAVDAYFVADISNPNGGRALTGRIGAGYSGNGTTEVPEPFTASLFGAGLAGAAALRRRKAKKS